MSYTPNTETERNEMLKKIGVASFDELISKLPQEIKFKGKLNLPEKISEYEALKLLKKYADMNKTAANNICFMGGGAYDHFIPSIVGFVLDRAEFKTAYTPYQAEVSQGTLQAMYEYQSMVCNLTGMDVSNASLYDGASALAEACLMANSINNKKEFLIAGTINPHYLKVMQTICSGKQFIFKSYIDKDGTCDLDALASAINENTSAVIVQQPNAYGNLEEVWEIEKITHSKKALYIVSVDPLSLGILSAPAEYNADIVTAEGQSLGIPLSYGGPYLGIFATKKDFLRKMPGRIAGITQDIDGNRGFVLTLQTREQQIKREKATSNICTNQGLYMLAATVYMATLGKQGIKEVAELCFQNAHYLASQIQRINGYELISNKPFFKEFLVIPPISPSVILEEAEKEGILGGIDTGRYPDCKRGLLIAVTEKRTKDEIEKYLEILRRFEKQSSLF